MKVGKFEQVDQLSLQGITGVHQRLHHRDLPQGDDGHGCIVGGQARACAGALLVHND